jgi:hypothetical protein
MALHGAVVLAAPRFGGGLVARLTGANPFDFGPGPLFKIPGLEASFVARALGTLAGVSAPAQTSQGTGSPVTATKTPGSGGPAPAPHSPPTTVAPLFRGAAKIVSWLKVNATSVQPGDTLRYVVVARNDGDVAFTATFVVDMHTPRGAVACTETAPSFCILPGDYDGASTSPSDPHVLPPQTQSVVMIPAHQERVVRTLIVQVAQALPAGTVLHNHAHIDLVGDNQPAITYLAPEVIVR